MGASPELSEGSADHKFLVNRETERPDPRGRCEASRKRSERLGGKERGLERARNYNSSATLHNTLT